MWSLIEVLCEDHVGTYRLPWLCRSTREGGRNERTGELIRAVWSAGASRSAGLDHAHWIMNLGHIAIEAGGMSMRGMMGAGFAMAVHCFVLASPAGAQTAPALSQAETRELIDAAKATAKATREAVDYARVTPDILQQILTKLDKIEDKLDKVENAVKAQQGRRGR